MTDNVRKIFDILGVEPNEEFKVEGLYGTFYFDQYLNIKNEYDYSTGFGLQSFINGLYKIIKLPKRKKLRDFTPEDYKRWRCNNCSRAILSCEECIFDYVNCNNNSKKCWVNNKDLYSDKFLDQELEVEE